MYMYLVNRMQKDKSQTYDKFLKKTVFDFIGIQIISALPLDFIQRIEVLRNLN